MKKISKWIVVDTVELRGKSKEKTCGVKEIRESLEDLEKEVEKMNQNISEELGDLKRVLDGKEFGIEDLREASCLAYEINYAKENSEYYDST